MRRLLLLVSLPAMLFSCEIKVHTGDKTAATDGPRIRNGIAVQENGLKVSEAYLVYDDGSVVSNANRVDINQKVQLRLFLQGWKQKDGIVKLGASEKIGTSSGDVLLDSDDLFKSYADGVSEADAELVTLSAVITRLDKLYDYFLVQFRVWDKEDGGGEVTGSYKLYLQ